VSLHKLLLAQKRVRWDWLSPAIAVFTALNIIAVWWATYNWYQRAPNLTMLAFVPDFILLVLLFLTAAAALPDDIPADGLDLREFYFSRSRYFWTLNLLQLLMVAIFILPRQVPAGDWQALAVRQAENLPHILLVAVLVLTKRLWVHRTLVAVLLAFLVFGYVGAAMDR
jgi:hypothetical protein